MAINWIETEVIEHIKWTDTLASLKFKGTVLPYTSGQFTKVGLKIDGELVSRPYSYVSSPNDDYLEIVYVNVPDGLLTPKLHNLKVGDKLFAMEKSSGFFTMSEVPDGKNLWMLASIHKFFPSGTSLIVKKPDDFSMANNLSPTFKLCNLGVNKPSGTLT